MEVESAVRTVVRLGAAAVAALILAACSIESADGGPEAGEASDGYFTSEDVNTVFIEEMTWTEVREAIDRGATTVILPTAGTEQNGPHMVTGKHRYIIEEATDRIARELGDALVAPTVTYVPEGGVDPPSGHMQYAGTITLPNEFFMKLVEYAARSFRAHGFTDIAFIGDSGGNQRGMEAVATMLNEEWGGEGSRVHFIGDYYANNGFRDWLVEQGELPDSIGGHAGISDTSILLYVEPRHIRQDRLAPGGGFEGSGVSGNPTRASAEYARSGCGCAWTRRFGRSGPSEVRGSNTQGPVAAEGAPTARAGRVRPGGADLHPDGQGGGPGEQRARRGRGHQGSGTGTLRLHRWRGRVPLRRLSPGHVGSRRGAVRLSHDG